MRSRLEKEVRRFNLLLDSEDPAAFAARVAAATWYSHQVGLGCLRVAMLETQR